MIFCNLAVSKQKLRPSERQEHRIPNLRKALAVARHSSHSMTFEVFLRSLKLPAGRIRALKKKCQAITTKAFHSFSRLVSGNLRQIRKSNSAKLEV